MSKIFTKEEWKKIFLAFGLLAIVKFIFSIFSFIAQVFYTRNLFSRATPYELTHHIFPQPGLTQYAIFYMLGLILPNLGAILIGYFVTKFVRRKNLIPSIVLGFLYFCIFFILVFFWNLFAFLVPIEWFYGHINFGGNKAAVIQIINRQKNDMFISTFTRQPTNFIFDIVPVTVGGGLYLLRLRYQQRTKRERKISVRAHT